MATQIRVKTQDDSMVVYLDLSDDQPMTSNFQFKDIQSFDKNKGNHTYNFRIPSTPNNDLFFGQYFEVTQSGNYNPKKRVEATITKDTIDVFSGYLQLTNVFIKNDIQSSYECVVFSSVASLGQALDGKYLSEYDWSEYLHSWNLANIISSFNQGLFDGDIVYSLYDYGGQFYGGNVEGSFFNEETPIGIGHFRPQIRLNKVITKILNESGFTYTSDFLDTELDDVYIDINNGISNAPQTGLNTLLYNVNVIGDGTQTILATNGNHTIINDVTTDDNYTNESGNYNETSGVYSPVNLWLTTSVDININFTCPSSLNGTFYQIMLLDITTGEIVSTDTSANQISGGVGSASFSSPSLLIDNTHTFSVELFIWNSTDETDTITITSSLISFDPNGTLILLGTGASEILVELIASVDIANNMPKVKALDFIKAVATKFNLVIIPDEEQPTHLYLTPYKDWIEQGNELDWTDKLDTSKDVQLKPTTDLQAKSLLFTDAKSNDFQNALFEQQTGKIYGSQYVDNTSSDFGKTKQEIKTIFVPTITSYIPNTSIRSCICYDQTYNNTKAIRLSYYAGYLPSDNAGESMWLTDGMSTTTTTEITSFPIFQNYEDAVVTPQTKCLSFMGETTGALGFPVPLNGAYSVYWKRFLEETYSRDARILTGTFRLSALDIMSMNFNDIVFVKNTHFRINKISNYPLIGTGTCSVELVKVERVNVIDAENQPCLVEPVYSLATGQVIFENTSTGVQEVPSQDCCEAFNLYYASGKCWNQTNDPNDPNDPVPNPNIGTEVIVGDSLSNGVFNDVFGNGNSATNFTSISGTKNLIASGSDSADINGHNNIVKSLSNSALINGDNNIIQPLSQNLKGSLFSVFTRQQFKNTSILGDYGLSIASGEAMISAGADPLYNKNGRSQSGQFIRHAFTHSTEQIKIGQSGQYVSGDKDASILGNGNNAFRLQFPSQMMFEMTVSGSERGTAANRSQDYSFRKYSGVIRNNNNYGRPSIENLSTNITKESKSFDDVKVSIEFPMPYVEGSSFLNEGLFYVQIDTDDATGIGDVDWTINFNYTFQTLQNIDRVEGQAIFKPTGISDCILWLDCTDVSSIDHVAGFVEKWEDKSGNGHDCNQTLASNRPKYNEDLSDPAIDFDGVDNVLVNGDSSLYNVSDGRNTTFVVFNSATEVRESGGQMVVGVCGLGRQKNGIALNVTSGGSDDSMSFINNDSSDMNLYLNTVSVLDKQVGIGTRNGTTQFIEDNAGNTTSNTSGANTSQDIYSIGATYNVSGGAIKNVFKGSIYEVIVYEEELTTSEIAQVKNYLISKWNT